MSGVLESDFPWTESQEEVIEHRDGPIQVIACAGSGKTQTISARIAQMVHDGIERDNILAFTFTENAAEELKVRIREWMQNADLENESLGDMSISTIHAFCEHLLNEYQPQSRSYDVLDENEQAAFLSKHYFDIDLHLIEPRHPENKYKKIDWFTEDINTIRRELIVDEVRESEDRFAEQLTDIYDSYRDLMERFHFFDYQELIYRAIQMLESRPGVLEDVRENYEYIVIDEYQDVNRAQSRLVELLAGEDMNICVVGDDDQSIYGWRGARPDDFRSFPEMYGCETEILAENFRSTDLIVDLAREFIRNNENRVDKPMESDRQHDIGDVYQYYFDQEQEEVEFIADRIEEIHGTVYENPKGDERTLRYGDIGILFRKKKHNEQIQDELERRGIPYTIRGQNSVFDHGVASFIRLAFGYIARGQEEDPESGIDSPVEIWDESSEPPGSYDDTEYFSVSEDDLRVAITAEPLLREREEVIITRLNALQEWYQNPSSRRIEPQAELQKILAAIGISELDEEDDDRSDAEAFPEPVMYNIGQISELIKDFETVYEIIFPDQITELVDFLDYSYYGANLQVEDPTLVNAVDLLTIHSAKGLEYPAVFVPGLTTLKYDNEPSRAYTRQQEWLPNDIFDYSEYVTGTEEKRRLFYVAITRAQKYLCLTGARQNIGYTNAQNESQYFEEVDSLDHSGVMTEPSPDPTPREPREIPSFEQDYIYPTSFSDLRYYQKCPFDYKLRKIYGFAPPIDQAFGYGFAVHDVLREMHERHEEAEEQMVMSPGEIRGEVQDPDRFHLRYAAGEVEDNLRNAAEEMLIDYSQDYQDDLVNTYRAEVPFELLITDDQNEGTALVSGAIDLLERRDPETNEIVEVDVIDFKTSEEPDDNSEEMRDNRFQVRLYGLAAQTELDLDTVDGYIHYLGENEEERIPVDLSDARVEQVEQLVRNRVDQIMRRQFFADPEDEKCASCDFETICPHSATH